jgi:hypothetical protein
LVGSGVITLEQRGVLNDVMYMDEEVCVAVTERKNPADPIDGFVVRVVCQTVDPEVSRQVEKWERWLDRFQRLSRNREQSAADDMAPRSTRQRASRTERIPTRSGG